MDIVLDYFDDTVAFSFSVWLSSFGIISARIGWVELRSSINYCVTLLGLKSQTIPKYLTIFCFRISALTNLRIYVASILRAKKIRNMSL